MLNWFEKDAPIRMKFRVLMAVHILLSSVGLVTTWIAGGDVVQLGVAALAIGGTGIVVSLAANRICTPYVNTVLRMEALAEGDTSSSIDYTDYKDCVGRMTKAMATFRDNAVEVQESRVSQDTIVKALSSSLKKLSQNDLNCEITERFSGSYDELRQDFNAALTSLSGTISAVRGAATSVLNGASEIRSASDDLAERNEQQAASLEETAAAMNQVTGSVKDTAANAADVTQAITNAHREATAGGEVVSRATESMAAIEKSAQEITQIISVIDGIAFQTNLLALNAGVEAARAGDAGKGFAVVANEVRALAQRSAEAAKDISKLITASTEQVSEGVTLVGETGTLLEKIVTRVSEVNESISDIAKSANTQSVNLQQINASVGEMDRMTQQNAAMVEEATAAARSLANEAQELTSVVSQFQIGNETNAPIAFPVVNKPNKRIVASMPLVNGNLALKASGPTDGDDWSEF